MPPHFLSMVGAELRIAFSRNTGRAVLVVGFAVSLLLVVAVALIKAQVTDANAQGGMVGRVMDFTASDVAGIVLWGRNFFVLPLFLLLATGGTLAAELADHTLRELLVRPVPRWSVVLAKLISLSALSAVSLVLSLAPALVGGMLLSGQIGNIGDLLLGYLASGMSDVGLISMGLLAGTIFRSAGGVVVAVIAVMMADLAGRALLLILGQVGLQGVDKVSAYFPSHALAFWHNWDSGFAWQPVAGLVLLIAVCLGGTLVRLQRMDVP